MKKILCIARNELYTLFYSPIAWLLLILFLVMTSVDYISITSWTVEVCESGGEWLRLAHNLTKFITTYPSRGYFPKLLNNLYIFFPLITMGLISRETSSGTIKLLYSSPVRIKEIVLGKFLAALFFALCMVILLIFTLIGLSMTVIHPDYGQMAVAVFGIFLVLAAYASIGLFISSLTSYQIVAAIITLGVFAFLSNVGDLWQDIDFVRGVTYYMDVPGKADNFIKGLMNLRDFTYFLLIIVSFLLFTIIRIKSATESVSNFRKAMRYIMVIAVVAVIGYITNKPSVNVYYDGTRYEINTITPQSQSMIRKLNEDDLEITVFSNLLSYVYGAYFTSNQRNNIIADVWEPYIRFKPNIKIHFVNYYDTDTGSIYIALNPGKSLREIAEIQAKAFGSSIDKYLSPEEVNRLVDTRAEDFRNFFQLKYKGKTVIVRTFDDPDFWPSEN
jgi:ABC-2 type transport system permease protein